MQALGVACALALAVMGCGSADSGASRGNGADAGDADVIVAPPDAAADTGAGDAAGDAAADGPLDDGAGGDAAADGSDAATACPSPTQNDVLPFQLTHAAYPGSGHPDVAVHVPPGFDPCRRPSLVVFFHGFDNCVVNAAGAVDTACTPGGPVRVALHLAEQLDAANVNAILVAPELVFDAATGNPGNLSNPGEMRAMLSEVLVDKLSPLLGATLDLGSFDRVVFASHSGGYTAVARALDVGGLDATDVELFDSLYGETATYTDWTTSDVALFDPSTLPARRFAMVWTTAGGTYNLSEQLESDVAAALSSAGLDALLFFQEATAPTPSAADLAHPFVFKHSQLSHYGVPLYYFQRVLAASDIAPIQ